MKKAFGFVLFFLCVSVAQAKVDVSKGFADLTESLLPAVVNISTTQKVSDAEGFNGTPNTLPFLPGSPYEEFFQEFFKHPQQKRPVPRTHKRPRPTSLGSGFIIDAKKGYVVTNNHVIADADEITVILYNDTAVKATIIGRDAKTDLAVLKIETDTPLTALKWGDSDRMRVGDWILAIGNPFGLGGTVTVGIISARQRDIHAGPYDDFIQTDASINRGNSGGPMFDLNGQVIGINTAIYSPSGGSVGIGFAIPEALAQPVIRQLIEHGRTYRGWLGVRVQKVTKDIAEALALKKPQGALIAKVVKKAPADRAGLKVGDIILSLNGRAIDGMRRLPRIVADTPINTEVPVVVWRKGKKTTLQVVIGELEKAEASGLIDSSDSKNQFGARKIKELGIHVATLNATLKERFQIEEDSLKGVAITDLEDGFESDLLVGDVIVEANQESISTPADLLKHIKDAQEANRHSILLLIHRRGTLRFIAAAFAEE